MRYFDKNRPTIAGKPAYLFSGKPVAPLPPLYITPYENGVTLLIEMVLVREDGGAVWYSTETDNIEYFLSCWKEDPEKILEEMGWVKDYLCERKIVPFRKKEETVTLDDLLSLEE